MSRLAHGVCGKHVFQAMADVDKGINIVHVTLHNKVIVVHRVHRLMRVEVVFIVVALSIVN